MVIPFEERPDVWVDIEGYLPKYFQPEELSRLDTLVYEKARALFGETPDMLADPNWGIHHRAGNVELLKKSLHDLTQELIAEYSSDEEALDRLVKNPFLEGEFGTICFAITRLKMNREYLEKTPSPHPKMLQAIQTGSPTLYRNYKSRFEGKPRPIPNTGYLVEQYYEDKALLRKILQHHFSKDMPATVAAMYENYNQQNLNDIHKVLLDAKLVCLLESIQNPAEEKPALLMELFFNPKLKDHYSTDCQMSEEDLKRYQDFPDQIPDLLRLLRIAEKLDVIDEDVFLSRPVLFSDMNWIREKIMEKLVQKKLSLSPEEFKSTLESILYPSS